MVKPLKGIQRVKVPPDECVAGTSVASVAIHRATGGCRSVHSKEAGREDSAPKTVLIVMPTPLGERKAALGRPCMARAVRGRRSP
jgi:hypothetical protein